MNLYNWPAWKLRLSNDPGVWAPERWLLMYLHEQDTIDALAVEIKQLLAIAGKNADVRVQSVWIDGTPQAEFTPYGHLPGAKMPQCELADLLLCVRWELPNGVLSREKAVLVQAKVSKFFDELPSGRSTDKERKLFEECDRGKAITIYPGMHRDNPIGSYELGYSPISGSYGLRDCANFLLMATRPWLRKVYYSADPMQVGWPSTATNKKISNPETFLESIAAMVSGTGNDWGREVKDGGSSNGCVWSALVNDLRGGYGPVIMRGYNKQARVTTSSPALTMLQLTDSGKAGLGIKSQRDSWRLEKDMAEQLYLLGQKHSGVSFVDSMVLHPLLWGGGYVSPHRLELWPENSSVPPSRDSDRRDGAGPHISTLTITIRRSDEKYE